MKNNSRRNFLKYSALTAGAMGISSMVISVPDFSFAEATTLTAPGFTDTYPYKLPPLGYGVDALEPYIDAQTMQIHHDKHHQAYIDKLNAALEKAPTFQGKNLVDLFAQINTLPEDLAKAIRNQGGGHYNHSFFWKILTNDKTSQPSVELTKAINDSFTSLDKLKEEMNKAATGVFGSGWAWLIADANKKLSVVTSANQDNPLMGDAKVKGTPILGIDVWEHAYYLKHQNKRAEYLTDIWNVISWKQVSENYAGD